MQIISLSQGDLKKTFGQKEKEKRDRKKNTSLTPDVCRWALWNEEHLQRGLKSSASVSSSYPPKSSVLFTLCPLQICQREFQLCLKWMRLSVLSHHLLLKQSYSYLIDQKNGICECEGILSPLRYSLALLWITYRIITETSMPIVEQQGEAKNKIKAFTCYSHAGLSWCRNRWSDNSQTSAHNCTVFSTGCLLKHLGTSQAAIDDKMTIICQHALYFQHSWWRCSS